MHQLRNLLSWIFALSSLACLGIVLLSTLGMAHQGHLSVHSRTALVLAVFSMLTVIYGAAWWTFWRRKLSARGWGIAASLTYIFLPLSIMYFEDSSLWVDFQLMLAVGIAGLLAFAGRYEQDDSTRISHHNARIPGDGTIDLLNRNAESLLFALSVGALFFVERWVTAKGIIQNDAFWPRILLVMSIVLIIATLHELGHTTTGLAFGMKLRAFTVGPFQWRVRDGKWRFRFSPTEILSGGATGVVPATVDFPRSHYLAMVAAGPLVTLLTGILALSIAFTADANSAVQVGGFVVLFGAWSLVIFASNLFPFKRGNSYSDGATLYQLLSPGPWRDLHRILAMIGSSLVTPVRPKNYDIETILRVAHSVRQGNHAMLLRLYAYICFLDQGKLQEAGKALREAESIYHESSSEIPAELHTLFVFGNAYVRRDAKAAREWWTRLEAKKPTHFNGDYWRACSALHWIEGSLTEANEAWDKCNALAEQLPEAGAYEFDRYCCSLLRKALDVSIAQLDNGRDEARSGATSVN